SGVAQDGRRHVCRWRGGRSGRRRIGDQGTRRTPRPRRGSRSGDQRGDGVMEIILLGIYGFFVWLIFFKFKWLPWNFTSQFIVITLPIVGMMALFLLLNISAPATDYVRAMNYVIPIVPRITGQVTEVPIQPNRPIKKGDVL